jgi:hypothetical protein
MHPKAAAARKQRYYRSGGLVWSRSEHKWVAPNVYSEHVQAWFMGGLVRPIALLLHRIVG